MRKSIFTIITLATFGQLHAQQIPNGGFENWNDFVVYEDPENWISLNLLAAFGGPQTAIKSTDAHSGNFALQLETSVSDIGSDGSMDTIPGTAVLGVADLQSGESTEGTAISIKPDSLTGWYKLAAPDGASCYILATLSKWNGSSRTDVGVALFNGGAQSNYNRFSVPFQYLSNEMPDTISITILNSDDENVVTNVLTVDDLELIDLSSAGLDEANQFSTLYPNPANDVLFLKNAVALETIELIDINGNTVLSIAHPSGNEKVDLQQLNPGVYFCKSTTALGNSQLQKFVKL